MVRGVRLIISALAIFEKIIAKLERGINYCKIEISENDVKIAECKTNNANMKAEVEKAEKAIEKLRNIIE